MRVSREFIVAMDMARYEKKPQTVGEYKISYSEYYGKYYAEYNNMRIMFDKVRYDTEDRALWFCIETPRKTIPVVKIPYRVDEYEE